MKYFMIIICCLILTACGTQQTDKLVIGLIKPSMNHLPVQYALDNISGEQKNYQFEYFHSGWETNEALVAGRIDLAIMPFTYAWMDVSQDKKVKIISFLERESDGIIAAKKFAKLQDLAEAKMGILKNSTLEIIPEMVFERQGLSMPEMVPFRTPMDMAAALQSGEVDAISYYVPSIFNLADRFQIVDWYSNTFPAHPCCDLVASDKALKSKAAQVRAFVKLLDDTIALMKDNPQNTFRIAQQRFGLSEQIVSQSLAHTQYMMGLEASGKDFEVEAAELMLLKGYLARKTFVDEVYHQIQP
ncbi:MAG: ABC transporter substrate-binding protein [Candidatus Stygibacter australis]|nr:ABC transporter substrate-binding protein [Candidatus Stygibacter australis]MDP8321440.1 ABC transporter substrate-binding protein [Candidatus Stygibacter australis]